MPAAPTTLTQRQLLVTLLDRQLLVDRARLSVAATLERMGGLQAQYAPSSYIGLWSRIEGFTRSMLDTSLEQRRVVQGTLMRSTIHLVSRADYWPLAAAVRQSRRDLWLRTRKEFDAASMDALMARLRAHLRATEGPHRAKDIEAALGAPIMAGNQWTDLVRVPPSGTWDRRRADLYALAEDWIDPAEVSVEDGTELAVRRYLGAFGPASVANRSRESPRV